MTSETSDVLLISKVTKFGNLVLLASSFNSDSVLLIV